MEDGAGMKDGIGIGKRKPEYIAFCTKKRNRELISVRLPHEETNFRAGLKTVIEFTHEIRTKKRKRSDVHQNAQNI